MAKGNGDMSAARAPRACEVCGREVSGNNYARHLATHDGGKSKSKSAPAARAKRNGQGAAMAASKAIGAYLAQLDEQSEHRANGHRSKRGATLGRLKGFPNFSEDPDEIERAADAIAAQSDEVSSYVRALKLQQRVIELREIAADLRDGTGPAAIEAAFVDVAAAWAESNGISYAAFRAMGVPAAVLREAGVS